MQDGSVLQLTAEGNELRPFLLFFCQKKLVLGTVTKGISISNELKCKSREQCAQNKV